MAIVTCGNMLSLSQIYSFSGACANPTGSDSLPFEGSTYTCAAGGWSGDNGDPTTTILNTVMAELCGIQGGNAFWKTLGNTGTVAATNFIGTTDAVAFRIRTNNTERIDVGATGNVGIGFTGATEKLQVAGHVTPNTDGGGTIGTTSKRWAGSYFYTAPVYNWTSGLATFYSGTIRALGLSDNGDVYFGRSTSNKTDVYSRADILAYRFSGDGGMTLGATSYGWSALYLGNATIDTTADIIYGQPLRFINGSTTWMYLSASGFLGIGSGVTAPVYGTPAEKCIIAGDYMPLVLESNCNSAYGGQLTLLKSRGTYGTKTNVQNGDYAGAISSFAYYGGVYNAAGGINVYVDTASSGRTSLRFYTSDAWSATECARFTYKKFFGINTTTPTTFLHVNGVNGFRYVDTNEGVDKILRSDANGVASWVDLTSIYSLPYEYDSGFDTVTYVVNDLADHGYGLMVVNSNLADYSAILHGTNLTIAVTSDWCVLLGGSGGTISAGSKMSWMYSSGTDMLQAGDYCVALNMEGGDIGAPLPSPRTGNYCFLGVGSGGRIWNGAGAYNSVISCDDGIIQQGNHNQILSVHSGYIQTSAVDFNTIVQGNGSTDNLHNIEGGSYGTLLNGQECYIQISAHDYNTIINGYYQNVDNAYYSMVLPGSYGVADRDGVMIQSCGQLPNTIGASFRGNAQGGRMQLAGQTIDAITHVELTHYKTGGLFTLPISYLGSYVITIKVLGTIVSSTDATVLATGYYSGHSIGQVIHGVVSVMGDGYGGFTNTIMPLAGDSVPPNLTVSHSADYFLGGETWTVTVSAESNRIKIEVVGIADSVINWSADIEWDETRWEAVTAP